MAELAARRKETKTKEAEKARQEKAERAAIEAERALADDAGSEEGEVDEPRSAGKGEPSRPGGGGGGGGGDAAEGRRRRASSAIRRRPARRDRQAFFEDVVPGNFVRIGIGAQDGSGENMYRVAEVVGVKDGFRSYQLDATSTTKRLELAIGTSRRYFQINYISNTDDIEEINRYSRTMKNANLTTKTPTYINEKVQELLRAKNHAHTEDEVNEMLAKSKGQLKMKGNLALQRIKLQGEIAAAKEARQNFRQKVLRGEVAEGEAETVTDADVEKKEAGAARWTPSRRLRRRSSSGARARPSASLTSTSATAFQRKVEDDVGRRHLREEIEISAGRATVSDPFVRLPSGRSSTGTSAKRRRSRAAPAAAAPAAPSVDPAAAAAPADTLNQPGHRRAARDAARRGRRAHGRGGGGGGGGRAGSRAGARRRDVELDIDIADEVDTAKEAPAQRRPLLGASAAALPPPRAQAADKAEPEGLQEACRAGHVMEKLREM